MVLLTLSGKNTTLIDIKLMDIQSQKHTLNSMVDGGCLKIFFSDQIRSEDLKLFSENFGYTDEDLFLLNSLS